MNFVLWYCSVVVVVDGAVFAVLAEDVDLGWGDGAVGSSSPKESISAGYSS